MQTPSDDHIEAPGRSCDFSRCPAAAFPRSKGRSPCAGAWRGLSASEESGAGLEQQAPGTSSSADWQLRASGRREQDG